MRITKADGTVENFNAHKLMTSLKRAGAHPSEIKRIVRDIESSLKDGMRTQMIYQRAFQLLRESSEPVAARYSLRRAVFGLGPTGFPFEDFLGRIFEAEGYRTKRRIMIKGRCAVHEIDLAAYSPVDSFIAEAKFHMHPGTKSDLQAALYSYARYLDLSDARICPEDVCGIISLYVITNTKFTQAAVSYAHCKGIKLLSWDYPKNDSLHAKIERYGLYPITALTNISVAQKQRLLLNGTIICSDLLNNQQKIQGLGLSGRKMQALIDEISELCGSK